MNDFRLIKTARRAIPGCWPKFTAAGGKIVKKVIYCPISDTGLPVR